MVLKRIHSTNWDVLPMIATWVNAEDKDAVISVNLCILNCPTHQEFQRLRYWQIKQNLMERFIALAKKG